MNNWKDCRNILCIRADNMGDVIMTGPALHALKETFNCKLTMLTSKMGSLICSAMKEIDDTMVYNLPWVKSTGVINGSQCLLLCEEIRKRSFDGVIIFTVYSQNPLPAALLAYMSGIPLRLAYCRENPYDLLTHWVPDEEPYTHIRHQVQRDIDLVATIGAATVDQHLQLNVSSNALGTALDKLLSKGINPGSDWIILHPGVSDAKREYPLELWIETVTLLSASTDASLLITGAASETGKAIQIEEATGGRAVSIAGLLSVEEFIAFISAASTVISVNTSTVHIACAVQTPVIVLYALTNPQHTPWLNNARVLTFSVNDELKSRNEVIRFVNDSYFRTPIPYPAPQNIVDAVFDIEKEKIETDPVQLLL
jgi:ADP-heptose:LPS heptosyltransferase